ncbi:MAG: hypothetical protein LUQ26_00025 [Methylococcaceae bacterium]|nr:hypothetical protein [Methylococcaceae bacterium]
MGSKRKILFLAIWAFLTTGVASYPMLGYADDNKIAVVKKTDDSDKSDHDSEDNSDVSDADERNTSGDNSSSKITICHVPPGNPANKHTIHIAFSAWAAHKLHRNTNTQGLPLVDYLGSCNNPPATGSTVSSETLHVISGCTGSYRDKLVAKVHSYFDPVTVADTSLDDESVVTAMSQCLDKGDSSDSGHSHNDDSPVSGGKGRGHDSVSDSGNHHRIRGCQNKDTHLSDSSKHGVSDSDKDINNKNYHKKLKDTDINHDIVKGYIDPVVVSDSSLDDSGVWAEFKKCAQDSSNPNKFNTSITGKKKGDSGHKQHVLKTCGTAAQDQKIKDAITAYRAKTSTKNIILTQTSYNDISIQQAVMNCVDPGKGGGTDTPVPSTTSSTGVSGRLSFREDTSPIKN